MNRMRLLTALLMTLCVSAGWLLSHGWLVETRSGCRFPLISDGPHQAWKKSRSDVEVQVTRTIVPLVSVWGNIAYPHISVALPIAETIVNVRAIPLSAGIICTVPIIFTPFAVYAGVGGSYTTFRMTSSGASLAHSSEVPSKIGRVFKSGIICTMWPIAADIFCDYYQGTAIKVADAIDHSGSHFHLDNLCVGVGVGITF